MRMLVFLGWFHPLLMHYASLWHGENMSPSGAKNKPRMRCSVGKELNCHCQLGKEFGLKHGLFFCNISIYIYIIWMPLNACLLFNGGYLAIDPLQWEKGFAAVPHRQWHLFSMCFHLRMMATISYLEWWSVYFTGSTFEVPPDDPADDDKSLS